jgi:hypothetical protein
LNCCRFWCEPQHDDTIAAQGTPDAIDKAGELYGAVLAGGDGVQGIEGETAGSGVECKHQLNLALFSRPRCLVGKL